VAARDDIKARLLATFRDEADEHLRSLTDNLLALERGLPAEQEREVVEATFRSMHTLKGAARSVSLTDVEAVCQSCERVLGDVARGRLQLTPAVVDRLQEAVVGVAALVAGRADAATARALARGVEGDTAESDSERRRTSSPPGRAADGRLPTPIAPADTIRIDAAKLDALLLQGEELLAAKLSVAERAKETRTLVAELERSAQAVRRATAANGGDGTRAAFELRDAEARSRALLERLVRDQQTVAAAVDRLLEQIRRTRMMPASTVLDLFPGMVRELARVQEKEIEWSARGAELELDRRVLEAVKDPLIHLVRNAIDHGIEPPEERAAVGKDRRARLSVRVSSLEDGRVELVLEDDGRGIDPERVREAAVRGRFVTPEAARALSDAEALELVFHSGLSTSPVITDVSGHGLGLAIVREQVERLEGGLALESSRDGTRVRMVVPASIATFHGLLVRAAARLFLVPMQATEQIVEVGAEDIVAVEGREAIHWRDGPLPLARLSVLLELPEHNGADSAATRPCAVIASAQERVGLLVDEVLGEREVLVKDISRPLVRVRHVAGVGILGSGEVVPILRAGDLARSGRRALRPPSPRVGAVDESRAPRVLVVDDAVTTRTMERNLLEAAGYRVRIAVDGAEAWATLRTDDFDLVLSDVDMPRMDGFELTARIRADARLADLPVVLVTALESREDKERGVEVGANAYVVKSSFEQSNLLEIIRRLGVGPGSAR
jgi:two-component system chemotaxis sensor kinase CheA